MGFLTVADNGGDVMDLHHLATGVTLTKGKLQDSFFELGWGKNQLFQKDERFRIDGLLTWAGKNGLSPFAELVVYADFGDRPDSIESYFGFDVDFTKLF